MVVRSSNNQAMPLDLVGSSTFGRYDKISVQKTLNMFVSDNFLVDYAGYEIIISSTLLGNGSEGRGIFTSTKLGMLVVVIDATVWLIRIGYNQVTDQPNFEQIFEIGSLQTSTGVVYITENNKPQILFSDNVHLYIYDTTISGTVQVVPNLNFTPGYITFHNTYFLCAASQDNTYSPPANNTWRLSLQNQGYQNTITFTGSGTTVTPTSGGNFATGTPVIAIGTSTLTAGATYYIGNYTGSTFELFLSAADAASLTNPQNVDSTGSLGSTAWPSIAQNVGLISTKPDNTQAVVRFPSKGNMIFVMGSIVTEAWFFTGTQLFPYQRNNQFNVDYGCISPATVAYMDEIVVWLAQNEKSGPIIMYSNGGMPKKITTDGIDFLFSELQNPQDSQGFLYRQDGHLFYHINFYSDNISLFYDFNTDKFYNASDQNMNYFIAAEIAFIGNQYYFITKNNGNLFAFDTAFTVYQDVESNTSTTPKNYIIPRIRTCHNIRLPSQEYFISNDVGFTIETGETNYYQQQENLGDVQPFALLEGGFFLLLNGQNFDLLSDTAPVIADTPKVFLSMSYDGGAAFGAEWKYDLPAIGKRRNRLMWWQCGIGNDMVCNFRFQSIGRFTATDGIMNIRT
jgi:hypothetical protein